ncbi:MAG: dienelactone hydrolase family protein [Xanthobacteraceae bacterium]|nr:dienelactone hydrolase family protein [Xanthobacteraceae bacterium]
MRSEPVHYSIGGASHQGQIIYDESQKGQPLLLVAPNWRGVVADNITIGERHAKAGYVVFMPDMFGVGKGPKGTENPMEFLAPFIEDVAGTRRAIVGALDAMTAEAAKRGIGDATRRAAVGYCYGGANVLDLAREGADVAAVVSIHGVLATAKPATKGGIKAKVLVLHGAADPVSPKQHRDMFEAEMDAAGARWMLLAFGGVVHAYTDPQANMLPVAKYDEPASRYTGAMLDAFITDAFNGRL